MISTLGNKYSWTESRSVIFSVAAINLVHMNLYSLIYDSGTLKTTLHILDLFLELSFIIYAYLEAAVSHFSPPFFVCYCKHLFHTTLMLLLHLSSITSTAQHHKPVTCLYNTLTEPF